MIKLGQRLHDKRIQKGLSLEDVTKAIKIRPAFLRAIEHGEYHKLPESAYAQGFITNYADYLGLSKRETLALFRREFDDTKTFSVMPARFANPADVSFSKFKIQQTTIIAICAFIAFFSYLGFSYKDAFMNPSISVSNLDSNMIKSGKITIKGKANPYDTVTVNKQPTYIDSNGTFSKTISVYEKNLPITIKAVNRFGRVTTIEKIIKTE